MFDRRLLPSTLCLGLAAVTFGCPAEPDSKIEQKPLRPIETTSALTAANTNIKNNIVGLGQAGGFLQSSDFFGSILNDNTGDPSVEPPTLEAQADEAAALIAEKILNASNVEVAEEKRIVLRLKAETICVRTVYDESIGDTREEIDAACAAQLEQEPVRIALTSRDEGNIDADLLIGAAQKKPLSLELHQRRLAATVDLGAALDTFTALARLATEEVPEFTGSVSGAIRVELIAHAAMDYEIATSIVAPIALALDVEGAPIRLSVGTASPLASIRFDGINQQLIAESNSGAMDLSVPLGAIMPQGESNSFDGVVDIHVPGAHGRAVIDGSDTIRVTGLGYDDAFTVRYDGIEIVRMDFNKDNGRRMDLELSGSEDGFLVAVRPLADLIVKLDLASLADEMEIPPEFNSEQLQIRLFGDSQPTIRIVQVATPARAPGDAPPPVGPTSLFEVVRGKFSIASQALDDQVEVNAGQCLLVNDEAADGEHPLSVLAAGACD